MTGAIINMISSTKPSLRKLWHNIAPPTSQMFAYRGASISPTNLLRSPE